jgi:hypothetical protein
LNSTTRTTQYYQYALIKRKTLSLLTMAHRVVQKNPARATMIMCTQDHTLDTSLISRDGGTLASNVVLQDGVCAIDRDLVVGLVTLLNRQVKVEQLNVQVREDQLVLDQLPDDTSHLIAVNVDDGVGDFDLLQRHDE